jgi:hypoxanthine phosphoribosyltransferase
VGDLPQRAELVASAAEVSLAYDRLAASLQPLVAERPCILMGLLVGGMVTLVQVALRLRGDFTLDVCHVTRYQGEETGGELQWLSMPRCVLAGQTVILIDDICDEGVTLGAVRDFCRTAGARDVLMAVLAHKRRAGVHAGASPDFSGLILEDRYVFGCGMDLRGRWRHLPALYALR